MRGYTTYRIYTITGKGTLEISRTPCSFHMPDPSDYSYKAHQGVLVFSSSSSSFLFFILPVLGSSTFSPPYISVSGLYASFTLEAPDPLCKPFLPAHKPPQYNTDDLLDCTTAYRLHTHACNRGKMSPNSETPYYSAISALQGEGRVYVSTRRQIRVLIKFLKRASRCAARRIESTLIAGLPPSP